MVLYNHFLEAQRADSPTLLLVSFKTHCMRMCLVDCVWCHLPESLIILEIILLLQRNNSTLQRQLIR